MTSAPVPKGLIVDITYVSYIDSVGEQVQAAGSIGVSFVARGMPLDLRRLRLPFYASRRSRKRPALLSPLLL